MGLPSGMFSSIPEEDKTRVLLKCALKTTGMATFVGPTAVYQDLGRFICTLIGVDLFLLFTQNLKLMYQM